MMYNVPFCNDSQVEMYLVCVNLMVKYTSGYCSSVSGAVTAGGIHNNQNQHPMIGKPRTTHNVIEKRYRLSINDKIVQLKDMVLGPEVKVGQGSFLVGVFEENPHSYSG